MITFSFNPINESFFPFIAASVNTLVVSWKDAADKKLSVASDAFVIPLSSGMKLPLKSFFASAGFFPSSLSLAF